MQRMIRFLLFSIGLSLFLSASVCMAQQDELLLKSGRRHVGTVENITEDEITIRTDRGVFTYPWDVVHVRSIQQYNLPLFEELRQQALEEREAAIRERGLVQYDGRWVTPEQKVALQKAEQGLEMFEGEWRPTNEVAQIRFRRRMEAEGRVEHDGRWFTEEELEEYKKFQEQKGLAIGMTPDQVRNLWGEPTRVRPSQSFADRFEMWFYVDEDAYMEDRVLFKNERVEQIQTNQDISE